MHPENIVQPSSLVHPVAPSTPDCDATDAARHVNAHAWADAATAMVTSRCAQTARRPGLAVPQGALRRGPPRGERRLPLPASFFRSAAPFLRSAGRVRPGVSMALKGLAFTQAVSVMHADLGVPPPEHFTSTQLRQLADCFFDIDQFAETATSHGLCSFDA